LTVIFQLPRYYHYLLVLLLQLPRPALWWVYAQTRIIGGTDHDAYRTSDTEVVSFMRVTANKFNGGLDAER